MQNTTRKVYLFYGMLIYLYRIELCKIRRIYRTSLSSRIKMLKNNCRFNVFMDKNYQKDVFLGLRFLKLSLLRNIMFDKKKI